MVRKLLYFTFCFLILSCGEKKFEKAAYLDKSRIIAVEASPAQLALGEEVTLKPVIYLKDKKQKINFQWKICPIQFGSKAAFRCVLPECKYSLKADKDGVLKDIPSKHLFACVGELTKQSGQSSLGQFREQGAQGGNSLEVLYSLDLQFDGEKTKKLVHRLRLYYEGKPELVKSPALKKLTVDGQDVLNKKPTKPLKKGEKIRLEFEVDESQNESYEIEGLGTIDENPFISFFASVGDFKYPKVAIKELSFNKWEIPEEPEQDKITLYLTLRDGTGGIRVYGPLDFDLE